MKQKLLYWIPTALLAVMFLGSGLSSVAGVEQIAASYKGIGYPLSLMGFLGVLKLLGVAALLAPGMRTLKEWAYAGFFFNMLGAAWAHLSVSDPIGKTAFPIVVIGLILMSRSMVGVRFAGDSALPTQPAN